MKTFFFYGSLSALALASVLAACSGDDDPGPSSDPGDATASSSSSSGVSSTSSSGGETSSSSSSGETSSSSSSGDAAVPLPESCEGDCQTVTLRVQKGERVGEFDRANFGFNQNGSLHIEAYRGGEAGCPQQDSATPDITLIITSPAPQTGTFNREDGARATLLDFANVVEEAPVAPSPAVVVLQPQAFKGEPREGAFYAFDLTAEFEGGASAQGHVYATYCPSLDE